MDNEYLASRNGVPLSLRKRKLPVAIVCMIVFVVLLSQSSSLEMVEYARGRLGRPPQPYLDLVFPLATRDGEQNWEDMNAETLKALRNCLTRGTCLDNQASVVLLASPHFENAVKGKVSGEDIWAASVRDALRQLGYSFFYHRNLVSASAHYRMFPDLVKVVIAEGKDVHACYENLQCIESEANLLGIPIWKIFSFHFWDGDNHPLGRRWTLSPEDYRSGNQYIGYSLEDNCRKLEFVPHDQRDDQVYILAKRLSYFYSHAYPWAADALTRIKEESGLGLVAGYLHNEGRPDPAGVVNLGKLDKATFFHHVSHSRAMLGIVHPWLSPSPYDALCFGVPFINPVTSWNRSDPSDRSRWTTQHNGLRYIDEPYVYHVFKGDTDGLVRAALAAKDNPIDRRVLFSALLQSAQFAARYIPPAMTQKALLKRVSYLVEHDWRSEAEDLEANRIVSAEAPSWALGRGYL